LEPWFATGRGRSPDATRVIPTPTRVIPTKEESSLDGTRVAVTHELPSESALTEIAALVRDEPRGLIVCGPGESPYPAAAAAALGAATGYPILADPLSGLRFGPHDRANIIDTYDPLLRDQQTAARLRPRLIIRVGAPPTSKPLQQFLQAIPTEAHVVIDSGPPRDPFHSATHFAQADEAGTLWALARVVASCDAPAAPGWLESWRSADQATRIAIETALAGEEELSEGAVAADIAALLPDGATLIAGNSMPIRDVDAFVRGDERRLRLLGNRGANGIDGMSSTALGAAAVADGPVALLVGDLSFLHDIGGLVASRLHHISATIVVINNDGGGIFSFLPQAEQLDAVTFEALFGTPTGFDVAAAARLFGASHVQPNARCAFRRDFTRALAEPGLSIVEVVTDRTQNVTQHREVWAAVTAALRKADPIDG
jgi:2-succinyl-5-enolpyruvyl-6-hydroxy-3-cyclohexene-1-carboxylate synthase